MHSLLHALETCCPTGSTYLSQGKTDQIKKKSKKKKKLSLKSVTKNTLMNGTVSCHNAFEYTLIIDYNLMHRPVLVFLYWLVVTQKRATVSIGSQLHK